MKTVYDRIGTEARKSQASIQIIQVSSDALQTMRIELFEHEPKISLFRPQYHHQLFCPQITSQIYALCDRVGINIQNN